MADLRVPVFSFMMRDIRSEALATRSLDSICSGIAAQESPTASGEDEKSRSCHPDLGPQNQETSNGRFDLEAYVKDAPQVRLVLLTIDQFHYLQALGEIGWSTEFGVSPIDNQQVVYAFSEDDQSMNAIARLITIDEFKDDEDGGVTPSPKAAPLPINDDDAQVPDGRDKNSVIETCSDNGDEDTTLADPQLIALVNDTPDNVRDTYPLLSRLYGLTLICIRTTMLLAIGGVFGAFGLWAALAYGELGAAHSRDRLNPLQV